MKSSILAATVAVVAAQPFMASPYVTRAPMAVNPYYGAASYAAPAYGAYGAYGRSYGYAQPTYAAPAPVAPEPEQTPESNLAFLDMLITLRMLKGGAGANVATEYVLDNTSGNMVKAGGSSNLMTMLMLSQGLGGTGANSMGLYNLLNAKRNAEKKYIMSEGASVTVAGNTYTGYTEAPGQGNALSALLWGGTGQSGLSAGSMLPILLMGGAGPFGTNANDLVSAGILGSGAW